MPPFQTPYVPSRMREQNNTIADLIQRGGAQQAEGIRRGGEISANMYGNLGQIASGAFQEYQQRKAQLAQEKALAPLREAQTMRAQGEVKQMQQKDRLSDVMANKAAFEAAGNPAMDEESLISNLRQNGLDQFVPDVMKDLAETRKAKEAHVEQTRYTIASVLDRTKKYLGTPLQADALRMAAQTLKDSGVAGVDDVAGQLMEAPADRVKLIFDNLIGQSPRYLEERTKGTKVVGDALVSPEGVPLYTAPEKPKAPESFSLSPGQMRFGPDGKVIATAPREPKEPKEVSRIWVMRPGPDGKLQTVRVSEAEIRPGDQPASTREQGRPVTSGDAGRIAELDNSLGTLSRLTEKIGQTGAGSRLGAALPDVVTEFTGWGSDSKQRQGTINLVKQIIGKALEGGVLRKEDEIKYATILPTIGDPPEVAKAKLKGLEQELTARKEAELSAREDAGYDVSKFRAREGAPAALPAPSPAARIPKIGETRNGAVWMKGPQGLGWYAK